MASPDAPAAEAPKAPPGAEPPVVQALGLALAEGTVRPKHAREAEADVFDAANFRQVRNGWWLDRLLPGKVVPYFAAAVAVCTAAWLIGLALRVVALGTDNLTRVFTQFFWDRQWQMQPLLLLVHFICLRLFKGIYSRNFDRAFRHLDVKPSELDGYRNWFLGARVNLLAVPLALPFIVYDALVFFRAPDFYARVFGAGSPLAALDAATRTGEAWFLLGLWTFEWLMFGYYCYLMIAGAMVVRRILRRHDFVDSVDLVLTERQFRPLFNVTAQAGSLIFFFAIIHAAYMFYTRSAGSDIAGLVLLVVLLGAAFAITWSAVRTELRGNVQAAVEALEASYRAAREKLRTMHDVPGIEDDIQRMQVQLKMQLALQQLDYLQNKYESLGRREMLSIMFKMLAPVGSILARIIRWGSLLAALGLGGAAVLQGGDKPPPATQPPAANTETPAR
ncbi:MAG: hypothetical protein IT463_04785 [Planctomycetes bacterium]|nr:hypothetical protein [Planctomycetota bacterium]